MVLQLNGVTIPEDGTVKYTDTSGVEHDLDEVQLNGVTVWTKDSGGGGGGTPTYPDGLSATATLTLTNDTSRFNWAYFDGTWFYAADGYGLRMQEIADYFNTAGFTGYSLSYTGTTIYIVSPRATGGDANGKVFTLQYRSRFQGDPDYVLSVALSGGHNADS